MAYAAILGLSQTVKDILSHEEHTLPLKKENIVTLNKNVTTLLTFLEDYSHKFKGAVNPLEEQIITAAFNAEVVIAYGDGDEYTNHFVPYSSSSYSNSWPGKINELFCILICWREPSKAALQKASSNIELILRSAMKIKNSAPPENVSLHISESANLCNDAFSDMNTKVSQDDFMVIKERIYNMSCNFKVIPIVGMGGIGKSTLARRLYDDSVKQGYFDRCIWIVVSQDYSLEKLLSDFVIAMKKEVSGDLKQLIYQELFGRRYLVVVDDLWSEKAWDDLNLMLPKDTAGSRVLVTTRLSGVASYVGSSSNPPYEVQLLSELDSWMLFEESVFGKGRSCPSELEEIGKTAVNRCLGLPLTIVVIAGLLKGEITRAYWENITRNIGSSEPTIARHCSKVLTLSYNHLPLYLRPCFLYVTAFPEDYEIKASRLIRLWIAEGFVKPSGSKLLEEVAEGYLHDLAGRSLIMVSKVSYSDRIKTIIIHDVLRDFGISTSQRERFHYHQDFNSESRRVTIFNATSFSDLLNLRKPATRSVLYPYRLRESNSIQKFRLLRVWDACETDVYGGIHRLVHLRYLSVNEASDYLLESISKLRNIQTLIIHYGRMRDYVLKLQLWKSPSLRHLILPSNYILERPYEDGTFEETSLQIIRSVTNLRFTKKVVEMLVNLRKLKVHYKREQHKLSNVYDFDLVNIAYLTKLEKLNISFSGISPPSLSELAFPKGLEKLSLTSIEGPWKDMDVVGSLPNLQAFKLERFWQTGEEGWEPAEGQFLKLKHLEFIRVELNHWEAESIHFPSLKVLVLDSMTGRLDEIPSGIGEISTLEIITLARCNKSIVSSAKQIQADQWDMGIEDLQLFIAIYLDNTIEKYEEIRPDKY